MKKIFWLTGSSFFDVDEHIVPAFCKRYEINWFVVIQRKSFFKKKDIDSILKSNDIKGISVNWPKLSSLKSLIYYVKLSLKIKAGNYDLIYIDFLGLPYMFFIFYLLRIDKEKIIYACHDFIDHVEIKNRTFITYYKKFVFSKYQNFHLFSKTQLELFNQKYKKNAFYAPLTLKGFGESNKKKHNDGKVHFLFFGKIQERKGLEYLIKATNMLCQKYSGRFIVKIYGGCYNWKFYEKMIDSMDCFELCIRRIENIEIPGIFSTSDYLILPYKDVTQSGPLLISYYYNIPVIASNHPGFNEYIQDGVNGFIFENRNPQSLALVMQNIIENKFDYQFICSNLNNYVKNELALDKILNLYDNGFNMIMNSNGTKY